MKKWWRRIGFVVLALFALAGVRHCFQGAAPFGKALGVVEIEGPFWIADDWLKQLDAFRKDNNIAGVVVRIQSPGGTVAAAQEIYQAIARLQKVKPVVASMGTVAASGGLYVALAAGTVVADPGTITGSIGVRMEHFNVADLLAFAKVEYETIKSGRLKDLASPVRSLTLEERGLLEAMMEEIHLQFKTTIAEARKLKLEAVEPFADGRIFTGAKAKEWGLVDEIGDLGRAVEIAKEKAGIEGEPKLIYAKQPAWAWAKALFQSAKIYFSGPLVCYLYP